MREAGSKPGSTPGGTERTLHIGSSRRGMAKTDSFAVPPEKDSGQVVHLGVALGTPGKERNGEK